MARTRKTKRSLTRARVGATARQRRVRDADLEQAKPFSRFRGRDSSSCASDEYIRASIIKGKVCARWIVHGSSTDPGDIDFPEPFN